MNFKRISCLILGSAMLHTLTSTMFSVKPATASLALLTQTDQAPLNSGKSTLLLGKKLLASSAPPNLFVDNQCHHSIRLAVRFKGDTRPAGQWITDGWWTIKPYQKAVIRSPKAIHNSAWVYGDYVYLFAETINANYSWSGSFDVSVDGEIVPMRQVQINKGQLTLGCSKSN